MPRKQRREANGEGTVSELPSGRWRVRVTVGRKSDGTPDRVSLVCDSEEEANTKRLELLASRAKGELARPDRMTVGDWMKLWVERQGKHLRANSFERLKTQVRLYVLPYVGSHKLQALRTMHVQGMVDALAKRGLSPYIQRQAKTLLESALRDAIRLSNGELIKMNPAEPVTVRAKATERKVKVWNEEQVGVFLKAAESHRLYALFYLAFATGMRREELLGLRWQDVSLEDLTLRIEQTLVMVKTKPMLSTPKTRNSRRAVYLTADVAAVLEGWKAQQAKERVFMGSEWLDKGLVFTATNGNWIEPHNLRRAMVTLIEKAGLEHLNVHGMRHTHATLLGRKGVPAELISKRLGHSRPSITLDIYRHVLEGEQKEAAIPLGELLSGKPRHRA